MGKVKEKKPEGRNPFGGVKLSDTAKNAPKELVRNALDDGTMRIASQMRDTVQQDQQDEYGGSQIENAALDASGMTARGVETFVRSRAEALFHHGNSETDEESPEDRPEQEPNHEAVRNFPEESTQEEPTQEPSHAASEEPWQVSPEEPPLESSQATVETPLSTRESVPETAGTLLEQSAQPEQFAQPDQSPQPDPRQMESPTEPPISQEPPTAETPVAMPDKSEKRRKSHAEPEPVPEKKEETWKPAYQDDKANQKHGSGRKTAGKETADETGEYSYNRPGVRQRGSVIERKPDRNLNAPKGRNGKPSGQQPEVREKRKKPTEQTGNAADMGRRKLIRENARAVGNKAAGADRPETGSVQSDPVGIHSDPENLTVSVPSGFHPDIEPEYLPATAPDAAHSEHRITDYHIPMEREQQNRNQPIIRTKSDTPQAMRSPHDVESGRVEIKTGESVKTAETAKETATPREAVRTRESVPPTSASFWEKIASDCGRREFIRERVQDAVTPQVDSVPIEPNETAQTNPAPSGASGSETLTPAEAQTNGQASQQIVQSETFSTEAPAPVTVTADLVTADTATADSVTVKRLNTAKGKPVLSQDNRNPIPATAQEPATPRQDTLPVKTKDAYVLRENPPAIRTAGPAPLSKETAIREKAEKAGEKPAVKPDAKPAVKVVDKRTVSASHGQERSSNSILSPASSMQGPETVKQKPLTVKARGGFTGDLPAYGGDRTEKPSIRQRDNGAGSAHEAGSRIAGNPAAVMRQVMTTPPQSVNGSQSVNSEQEQKGVKTREAAQRNAFVPVGGVARRSEKKQPAEAAHETGCPATDNMTGNPMDILCPDSPVQQNQALPVQPETVFPAQSNGMLPVQPGGVLPAQSDRLALPEVSAEGTVPLDHQEPPAHVPAQTDNSLPVPDTPMPDTPPGTQTTLDQSPMTDTIPRESAAPKEPHLPQESVPEKPPVKTREAYVQRQSGGKGTTPRGVEQGRMGTAREFARKNREHGKPAAAADIKTRESVLQAQSHSTDTIPSPASVQTSQEPVRAIPDSQVKESPRELRKTVRTREGPIEEPKTSDKVRGSAAKSASGEHDSAADTPANLRGPDAAGASREETASAHASRIERGDTAAALSGNDAPASPAAEQRTPDIKTRTASAQREASGNQAHGSQTVEQGRQRFVRERKRQADSKRAAEHGREAVEKGIPNDGTAVPDDIRNGISGQEIKVQNPKTKEAWLRQHGMDRPRERTANIHGGRDAAHPLAGNAGFPGSTSNANGANLKGRILELPPADVLQGSIKTRAGNGRWIREKGAAAGKALWETVSGGNKAVKAAQPVVIKEAGKTGAKAVKTAERTAEKGVRKAAMGSARMAHRAKQAAQASAKAKAVKDAAAKAAKQGVRTIKEVGKAVAAGAKAAIAALGSLLAGLYASSIVVAVVLVVICLIGLLAATPFGLFLSGQTGVGDDNIQTEVSRLTGEYNTRLQEIQQSIAYDELDMAPDIISAMTGNWKNVLAVYAVRVTTDEFSATEVITMTDEKKEILRETFWDMNSIRYWTTSRTEGSGEDAVTIITLHIKPDTKDADDMSEEYHFNARQKKLLEELLSPEYDELFDALLSGSHTLVPGNLDGVLIPGDISETRRQIIETGSQLIGQVHYFWGGKSLVLGWDSRWGTPTRVWAAGSPSTGTVRPFGLDCSGYVDWVFYNVSGGTYVIGHGGGASAQHSYCTTIPWSEAQPGDLAFYPGDSHVGIIVGYDEAGNVKIMHCASGSQNGVAVTQRQGFLYCARPRWLD